MRAAGTIAARTTGPAAVAASILLLSRCGLVSCGTIAAHGTRASSSPPSAAAVPRHANETTAAERVDVCALNACEAYVRMRDDLADAVRPINEKLHGGMADDRGSVLEARLQRLDRRLRSVEQPGEYHMLVMSVTRTSVVPTLR